EPLDSDAPPPPPGAEPLPDGPLPDGPPDELPDALTEVLADGLSEGDGAAEDEDEGEADGEGEETAPRQVWVRLKNVALVGPLISAEPSSRVQPDGRVTQALLVPLVVMASGYGSDASGIFTVVCVPSSVLNDSVRLTNLASLRGRTNTQRS